MNSLPSNHRMALVVFLYWFFAVEGFTVRHNRHFPTSIVVAAAANTRSSSCLGMSDFDFPSAMPEKPETTLDEKLNQSADDFILNMDDAIVDKSTAPPELEALREARKANAPPSEISIKIYELMIERAMRFDADPDTGALTPTGFDIPNNLEIPEVKEEFSHLYSYGMMIMDKGLLEAEVLKEIVIERLIKRTGLTPEEFDKWLGY
mmetsp:Transcript_2403/g.5214  ORF Transcript_2403/g.5214 Transcript_2403/m.5214 type:complete len:206 (-) Transcript_2403:89-706(-)|eukprot:CAMPEP_0168181642 /NCGR_PEP_ID=MMETSP0139_2-20121125/11373_1 /TAXON_ID=44445 /ORGANISM="Pseudo-nitzschia australis, Strain 10249 10 AB" /LENGTH=205 /DNA_ID=CAMNT_0008102327 /DNA_START=64 /DNA_END=681 /DNA_ORIENTATION=+